MFLFVSPVFQTTVYLFFHDGEESGVCAFQGISSHKSWLAWFLFEINRVSRGSGEHGATCVLVVLMLWEERGHCDHLKFNCCWQWRGDLALTEESSPFQWRLVSLGDSLIQTSNVLQPPYGAESYQMFPGSTKQSLAAVGHRVPAVLAALGGLAVSSLQD